MNGIGQGTEENELNRRKRKIGPVLDKGFRQFIYLQLD